jgi:hypothetical protein
MRHFRDWTLYLQATTTATATTPIWLIKPTVHKQPMRVNISTPVGPNLYGDSRCGNVKFIF